jgi:hypothetical protein
MNIKLSNLSSEIKFYPLSPEADFESVISNQKNGNGTYHHAKMGMG